MDKEELEVRVKADRELLCKELNIDITKRFISVLGVEPDIIYSTISIATWDERYYKCILDGLIIWCPSRKWSVPFQRIKKKFGWDSRHLSRMADISLGPKAERIEGIK